MSTTLTEADKSLLKQALYYELKGNTVALNGVLSKIGPEAPTKRQLLAQEDATFGELVAHYENVVRPAAGASGNKEAWKVGKDKTDIEKIDAKVDALI